VNRFRHVVTSELTKIRTVRSTAWALLLTPLACIGLGCVVSLTLRASFPRLPPQQRQDWDPLFASFYSLSIGQIALAVFGVTVAAGEYPTKMIMTSLTVVPRRGLFYAAKVAAGLLAAAGTAVLTVTATFFAAQLVLGPLGARAGTPGTLQAALGAWLYLTLICGLAMGIAAITRSPVFSLVIIVPLLFLDSQGLGNVPGLQRVIDYLPDQAGALITHISGAGHGHFGRAYGPWTGMAIMAAWVAAVLIGGYLVLVRTDISGGPRRGRTAADAR
jgi:ABC-type transport system involved in multi-copper enzyme maturation permease subunit